MGRDANRAPKEEIEPPPQTQAKSQARKIIKPTPKKKNEIRNTINVLIIQPTLLLKENLKKSAEETNPNDDE